MAVDFWKSGERKIRIQPIGAGAPDGKDANVPANSQGDNDAVSIEEVRTLFNSKEGGVNPNV